MAEFTPHFAPIVVLLFLGAIFAIGISFLVLLFATARRSPFLKKFGAGVAITIPAAYLFLLCGVSAASSEKIIPPGGWKYFCEIDCHLAYAIVRAQTTGALGTETHEVEAHGKFVVIRVKTWFDERTISPHRGNGPLTPNRRKVVLVDNGGHRFTPSPEGQTALAYSRQSFIPLTQPLRPGESYQTDFAFDIPKDAEGLRLLITEDDPETMLVIGHENSLLHMKIYLGVDSVGSLSPLP